MTSINPPLTKEDFINSGWQDVVNASEMKDFEVYKQGFKQKQQEAEKAGNIRQQAVFGILAKVTLHRLPTLKILNNKYKSHEEYFIHIFTKCDPLIDEELNFLTEIAPEISDPELQARIADILWSRRHNKSYFQMAQLAINAYIKSAINLENSISLVEHPRNSSLLFNRIERAFILANKINNNNKLKPLEKVVEHIEKVIDRYQENPYHLSARLMKLLQENKLGDPKKYAVIAEKAARLAESSAEKAADLSESSLGWEWARDNWEIKAKWHSIEKDRENEIAALMLSAETYFKEAEYALKNNYPSYTRASFFLKEAIEAFRNIPGTKEETATGKARAEEAHKLLVQYQQESMKESMTISFEPIDFTEEAKKARASVRGKKLQDALFSLAFLVVPTKVSELQKEVEQMSKDYLLSSIPKDKVNQMGKVVAKQSSEPEAAIKCEMYKEAVKEQKIKAIEWIEPAREQINLEHSVQLEDFLPILENNPFVPPERVHLFAKGLYAGLTGDFYTSTHILIPQIENSIRYLLERKGVVTSKYDKGIQDEKNLNKILDLPEINHIFNEDTLFDLKGLLVEHSGSNLRNCMAHGLLDDEDFSSPLMSYLWWVMLRRCCSLFTNKQQVDLSDPWVRYAGMFKDDPFFDEFVENMAAYRREVDEQVTAQETTAEESQSE
ncbi:MAG: DUF4209 domain-containing protein [Microcoleaceae cyanobacterium MO_207.B10]|nr:DUF4209 domain-containing protein [Microcoleaceae cyanobacterium MO_207.B10]